MFETVILTKEDPADVPISFMLPAYDLKEEGYGIVAT